MNNIILSDSRIPYTEELDQNKIIVKGKTVLDIINSGKDLKLNLCIEEDSSLVLNMFDFSYGQDINIYVESKDRSKFILNDAFIANNDYSLNIDTNLYGDDIETDVKIRGINEVNGNIKITMNGQIAGETKNNILSEYAKIINNGEKTNVLIPNLIVNTCDVVANHGVSVGNFTNDEYFYMMSKGISESKAKKLMEEGFLLSIMDDENKETVKNILMGR